MNNVIQIIHIHNGHILLHTFLHRYCLKNTTTYIQATRSTTDTQYAQKSIQVSYTTSCGTFGWERCKRYRTINKWVKYYHVCVCVCVRACTCASVCVCAYKYEHAGMHVYDIHYNIYTVYSLIFVTPFFRHMLKLLQNVFQFLTKYDVR